MRRIITLTITIAVWALAAMLIQHAEGATVQPADVSTAVFSVLLGVFIPVALVVSLALWRRSSRPMSDVKRRMIQIPPEKRAARYAAIVQELEDVNRAWGGHEPPKKRR